ncbi:hypothetical protein P8452_35005 [Trifolium repens]|nr:hypothetical protein P8452_35005 [Trifolium repens]
MALCIKKDVFPQQFIPNVRVLVIDHDINRLNAIDNMCSQLYHEVKTCSKVYEALYLLMERMDRFDLVLIEAKMPDMDSYDFMHYATYKINIPVIVMGVDDKSAVLKAITNGACDYWIKPMSENQIKNMWQHVLRKLLNESKNQENNKNLEVEDMKKGEGDVSKLSLIDGTIIGYIKNNVENNKDNHESSTKKARFVWSPELHEKFVSIVTELNIDRVTPKKILERMNVTGLTRRHVASHLQKFRLSLKRGKPMKVQKQNGAAEATESNNSNESDSESFYSCCSS